MVKQVQVIDNQTGRSVKFESGKPIASKFGFWARVPQFIPMDKNTMLRAVRLCNEKK